MDIVLCYLLTAQFGIKSEYQTFIIKVKVIPSKEILQYCLIIHAGQEMCVGGVYV